VCIVSKREQFLGSYESENESYVSKKGGEFLYYLKVLKLLKKDFAVWAIHLFV
jgi:hypothetical protein